jgi:hypothetical protein
LIPFRRCLRTVFRSQHAPRFGSERRRMWSTPFLLLRIRPEIT